MDGQASLFETFVRTILSMTSIFVLASQNLHLIFGIPVTLALIFWAVHPMFLNLKVEK